MNYVHVILPPLGVLKSRAFEEPSTTLWICSFAFHSSFLPSERSYGHDIPSDPDRSSRLLYV